MAGNFKVHAFGVVAKNDNADDLEDILNDIKNSTLDTRLRNIGGNDIRVEHIKKKDGLWRLDFVKFRDVHGPGKGAKSTEVSGFSFKSGEVFCEETALIYNPKKKYILIQYNHHGVRYSAIEDYFSSYSKNTDNLYEFQPKYDEDVDRIFTNRKATKSLTLSIDPRLLSDQDRSANTALTSAIAIGDKSEASKVEITIHAGRSKKKYLSKYIDDTIEKLKIISENNPDAVKKIKAQVVDNNLDEKIKVLDLIEERLCLNYKDIQVGADKRWPRLARYKALEKAKKTWSKKLE